MRQVQIVRAIFAILFLFLGILLFCYASQYEGTWHIIIEDLGLVIAIIGDIVAILYMREFIRGFSWGDFQPKKDLESSKNT